MDKPGEHQVRVLLSDGTEATVRMVQASDKDLLRAGFAALSDESRYHRFFSYKAALTNAELKYLTEIDAHDHVAIGASYDDAEERVPMGLARFVRDPEAPERAEVAVTVVDHFQRRGLGRVLLALLSETARAREVSVFRFYSLRDNAALRALVSSAFPHQESWISEDGLVVTDARLGPESGRSAWPRFGPTQPRTRPKLPNDTAR